MGDIRHLPVIVRVAFLEKKRLLDTGKRAYGLLILGPDGQIVARPCMSQNLSDVVAYVKKHRQSANLARVTFEPPHGDDKSDTRYPRRYEAIELSEIYYVSAALKQS